MLNANTKWARKVCQKSMKKVIRRPSVRLVQAYNSAGTQRFSNVHKLTTTLHTVYLQHGGGKHCRDNDVTVTPCTQGVTVTAFCLQQSPSPHCRDSMLWRCSIVNFTSHCVWNFTGPKYTVCEQHWRKRYQLSAFYPNLCTQPYNMAAVWQYSAWSGRWTVLGVC